ncbi:MAG: ArsI/CadI family heavy metal resistance metalloenzyme [Pseudomonadales bacterium]
MKRMHIHVGVEDLNQSIRFYSALFGAEPAKTRDDYAKWMLDDPRINFAISTRAKTGLDHLGLQVDEDSELEEMRERLKSADLAVVDEGETVCCYARSDKSWVEDPAGIAWEAYKTMEDVQLFSGNESAGENACCAPQSSSDKSTGCAPASKTAGCCS